MIITLFFTQKYNYAEENFSLFRFENTGSNNESVSININNSTVIQSNTITKIILDVPLINQMDNPKLYNGCEVTSLAMLLNFHDFDVNKNELAEKIPRVPLKYSNGLYGNPNAGFVGNMEEGPGYAVYHGPIYQLAVQYAGKKVKDLTGQSFDHIIHQLQNGLPVWVITTNQFQPVNNFQTWETPQGKIQITFSEHSVVLTGFDQKYIYLNNPYGTKNQKVDKIIFIQAWEQMGKQAIVITK